MDRSPRPERPDRERVNGAGAEALERVARIVDHRAPRSVERRVGNDRDPPVRPLDGGEHGSDPGRGRADGLDASRAATCKRRAEVIGRETLADLTKASKAIRSQVTEPAARRRAGRKGAAARKRKAAQRSEAAKQAARTRKATAKPR
jgi:hypothetical protein